VPDVRINGSAIHFETAGDGPPLVLLHGIGSNARSWSRQLGTLSRHFHVVAWDAPGYGQSADPPEHVKPSIGFYAESLHEMLQAAGLKQIFLLGHSLGGVIAQEYYRSFADNVRALMLADTRFASSRAALNERLRWIRSLTPAQLAAERAPKLLSRNASPQLIAEVASVMSQVRPDGYEFAATALAGSDTRDVLRNLRVPTLLIWGAEDEITPVWDELPPGVEVKIIAGAGHLCYVEKPEDFNQIVRDFLLRGGTDQK
jgi:pimeloyl-ACP methyl ester carboxylesterase